MTTLDEHTTPDLVTELLARIEHSNAIEFIPLKQIIELRGKLNQHIANIPITFHNPSL